MRGAPTSWPGRSAKRVFALDVPAIHVFPLDGVSKTWMPGTTSPGMTKKCDLLRRSREQQQITVRVLHNEISRAPGLALERLEKRHPGELKLEEQRFDFLRGCDGE